MEIKEEKVFNLSLKDKQIDNFKSMITKVSSEVNAMGFKKEFLNDDEKKLIKDLSEKL